MSTNYQYDKQYLWYDDAWQDKNGLAYPFFQWLGRADSVSPAPTYSRPDGEPKSSPYYHAKTNSVNLPEIIEPLEQMGLHCTILEQGCKHWIAMLPMRARTEKLRLLIVLHQQDTADPWWAMDTLVKRRTYHEIAVRRQDTLVVYLVAKGADDDRIFGNILQEACALYPVDLNQVYLDVSLADRLGCSLADIPGLHWQNARSEPADPDELTENFEGIRVLNISGRWGSQDSLTRGLVMNQAMNRGLFDTERLIHSVGGRKMAEVMELERDYQTIYDPGYAEYWDRMGLRLDINETDDRRWLVYAPKQQLESGEKLPLVLAMQEVYRGNEHLAVTAASYFYEYTLLAAQGECILLFFALEDPDSNDLLEKITWQAVSRYPVDVRRIYVTGHSHDGWFARHFAYRHPRMIAALATMGNHVGLPEAGRVGNPIMGVSDAEIENMKQIDMPTININGGSEGFSRYPASESERRQWALDWQRRLEASRCPVCTIEEILAAPTSDNLAIRTLGVPGDRGLDCWFDGIAHCAVDIKNVDGKYHLRVASSENMPHTVTPSMIDLSWSFLRQFARDTETGNIIG